MRGHHHHGSLATPALDVLGGGWRLHVGWVVTVKLSIVETLAKGVRVWDADRNDWDDDNRQAVEPVRRLHASTERPTTVPDGELTWIKNALGQPSGDNLRKISDALGIADDYETLDLIKRGDESVVARYRHIVLERNQARWDAADAKRRSSLGLWVFKGKVVRVEKWGPASRDEIELHVKHRVLSEAKAIAKLRREVELLAKLEALQP